MSARLARDDEVATWRDDGWIALQGLVSADEIDAARGDLFEVFPSPERYHADPAAEALRWLGTPPPSRATYTWPETGPGFRPEQHQWRGEFPFPGAGALNRLCVHPSIVDFACRALDSTDLRLYQASASAKYTGWTNFEQPMHTDRNHSWLPAPEGPAGWHVEAFLYLSDVDEDSAPTHLVSTRDAKEWDPNELLYMPRQAPELYALERPATGPRGTLLAYRSDVLHRGVDITAPGGSRFLLNASYKRADQDWIGFLSLQSRATDPGWVAFVEGSTPDELALFGFPPPGHAIWDASLLDATQKRYPNLDVTPWRVALGAT